MLLEIIGGVWAMGALIFFGFIRVEAARQEVGFNLLQLIVAIFWWLWIPWYTFVIVRDKWTT